MQSRRQLDDSISWTGGEALSEVLGERLNKTVKPSLLRPRPVAAKASGASDGETARIDWRDQLGFLLSALCLLHCLLTPVVLGLLPFGATAGFWHHGLHQIFLVLVPTVALAAFVPGWRRHRDHRIWLYAGAGVTALTLGVWLAEQSAVRFDLNPGLAFRFLGGPGAEAELAATIIGGLCLMRAHWLNRQLCRCGGQTPHVH